MKLVHYGSKRPHLDSLFSISLLNDSNCGIGDKNKKNNGRLDKCACDGALVPFLVELDECKNKRYNSRSKEDEDKLVLKLAEDKRKQGRRRFLGDF